ncbi:MAG TPA: HAD-IA family hydrolase [Blastocatellia bacterium]|nr:HAD-IA family hydrolase [Blastocatellia bacterium]HMV85797.1 HAD-IA family hydrolase [Blastocatellia bacterium]HMX30180.1 HAD-IA family hydrolase [Blastocatellia bacterium]HMY73442.1 HAD-IA family hydrolase [Blastocatellia bacterium]HMZ19403.1 HAD-IA family hydrolase [Blastocatellia bacterium]
MKPTNTLTPRIILFDFDGTLVNTTPLILRSFRATWQKVFGFEMADADYIRTFGTLLPSALKGLTEQCIADGRLCAVDDVTALAAELLRTYREFNLAWHDDAIEPFADVDEVLQELKARDYRLGIVSSKMRFGVERGLNVFAMAEWFDVIIAGDDVTNHKPHPEPLLKALEQFNAAPREAVYVGDSIHDIAAGRAAEIPTIAAAWGPFPRTELEELKPDYLFDEPRDLLSFLGK